MVNDESPAAPSAASPRWAPRPSYLSTEPPPKYEVTVTPTIMDGQVVRWRLGGRVIASASRNRVTINAFAANTTGVAALMDLLAKADRVRCALADGVDQSHLAEESQ